jgi:hypothetical protein
MPTVSAICGVNTKDARLNRIKRMKNLSCHGNLFQLVISLLIRVMKKGQTSKLVGGLGTLSTTYGSVSCFSCTCFYPTFHNTMITQWPSLHAWLANLDFSRNYAHAQSSMTVSRPVLPRMSSFYHSHRESYWHTVPSVVEAEAEAVPVPSCGRMY